MLTLPPVVFRMRDDCVFMTTPGDNDKPSVLANLPRTRPQRPSARRAATRRAAADTGKRTANTSAKRTPGEGTKRPATASPKRTASALAKPAIGSSARRVAGAGAKRTAKTSAKRPPPRTGSAPPSAPPAPHQGYETEDGIEPGVPVQPPSGTELATSVAELVGELAQAGLETCERLLRDAIGRFPGL